MALPHMTTPFQVCLSTQWGTLTRSKAPHMNQHFSKLKRGQEILTLMPPLLRLAPLPPKAGCLLIPLVSLPALHRTSLVCPPWFWLFQSRQRLRWSELPEPVLCCSVV